MKELDVLDKFLNVLSKTQGLQLGISIFGILFVTITSITKTVEVFGLNSLQQYRPHAVVLILLSVSLLLGAFLGQKVKGWQISRRNIKGWIYDLERLTSDEKNILKKYIEEDVRTYHFSLSAGTANGLEAKRIIYRVSTISTLGDLFAYNIQDGAFELLKKHPEWLKEC